MNTVFGTPFPGLGYAFSFYFTGSLTRVSALGKVGGVCVEGGGLFMCPSGCSL